MSGVDKLYYESICAKFSERDPTRYYGGCGQFSRRIKYRIYFVDLVPCSQPQSIQIQITGSFGSSFPLNNSC